MRATVPVVLVALFGALLLLPSAAAQSAPIVTVKTAFDQFVGDDRLRPETETWQGRIAAQIDVPPASPCVGAVDVLFRVSMMPHYATLVFENPKQTITIMPNVAATAYFAETSFSLQTSRDAPAYEDGMYQFGVEVLPPSYQEGCFLSPAEGSAQATVKNDYVPGVKIGEAVVTHDGLDGWIDVPVENLANGPTRVVPQFARDDGDPFILLSAPSIRLGSKMTDGSSEPTTDMVRISYVLDNVESAPVKVRFVASHDLFQSELVEFSFVYEAVGTLPPPEETGEAASLPDGDHDDAATVPGPSIPILMLMGAFLLALARRGKA